VNFSQFLAAAQVSTVNATKWLDIDQDNLQMKFSVLNVDFSSPSPDPLGSNRLARAGVRDGVPPKK